VEAVLKSIKERMRRCHGCHKNSLKRGQRDLGDERMVGAKQETKVTSGRRGEDWGGGEIEGRVGELDRSANKHEFSLGWVNGEKARRHPVGNVREKRNRLLRRVGLAVRLMEVGAW
jgi:hypothetical protein